jgi:hypothetical protein
LEKFAVNILEILNRARWRQFSKVHHIKYPVIVIVVPGLEHLAIPCVRLLCPFFEVVVVDNGLSKEASKWLKLLLPHSTFFKIFTSIRGKYILSHGDALDLLTRLPTNMVFLDPDCYIFEPGLIKQMFACLESVAIAALYSDPASILGFRIPDTYCFGLSSEALTFLRKKLKLRIGVVKQLLSPLLEYSVQRWGYPVPYPHPGKQFFDTIHPLAIAVHLMNMGISVLPCRGGETFHVLGTSYRTRELQVQSTEYNETALNAHYFHCLIAESLGLTVPNEGVNCLARYYSGSAGLLEKFPVYAASPKRAETDTLVDLLRDRKVLFNNEMS